MAEFKANNLYEDKWKGLMRRKIDLLKIATLLFAVSLLIIGIILINRSMLIMGSYSFLNTFVMTFISMESYLEIPNVISILFALTLWGISRQFEGRIRKAFGAAAILIVIPFVADIIVSIAFYLIGEFYVNSETATYIWFDGMIIAYNLSDVIFYTIAFTIIAFAFLRMKRSLGFNTSLLYSPLLSLLLLPVVVGTGTIFYFSTKAFIIYFWLEKIFYLLWAANCIELSIQLFRWKPIRLQTINQVESEEIETKPRIGIIDNEYTAKKILAVGTIGLVIFAGLWFIAQIVISVKGQPDPFGYLYEYFMIDFLNLIHLIGFFSFTTIGVGILLLDTNLKEKKRDWKLLVSGIIITTTIIVEAVLTVIFAYYRYWNNPLYYFSYYGLSYSQLLILVFEFLKGCGLILLGFSFREKRKSNDWKTNQLIIPFLYVPTILILTMLNHYDMISYFLVDKIAFVGILIILAMAIELVIRTKAIEPTKMNIENDYTTVAGKEKIELDG